MWKRNSKAVNVQIRSGEEHVNAYDLLMEFVVKHTSDRLTM